MAFDPRGTCEIGAGPPAVALRKLTMDREDAGATVTDTFAVSSFLSVGLWGLAAYPLGRAGVHRPRMALASRTNPYACPRNPLHCGRAGCGH